MFEAGVQVIFKTQCEDYLEVGMVDVGVDSEKSFENGFDHGEETFGERDADLAGEEGFIVELVFDPGHEKFYVFRSWHFERGFDILSVSPEILKLLAGAHDGAGFFGAEFGEGAIENRDFVIEFDGVDC